MDAGVEHTRQLRTQQFDTLTDTREILAHGATEARRKKLDSYFIVDIDCHRTESDHWHEVIEFIDDPVLRHEARSFRTAGGKRGGGLLNGSGGAFNPHLGGRIDHALAMEEAVDDKSVHRDVSLVRRMMECLALDYAIVFPDPLLSLAYHPNPVIEVALGQAYNRWMLQKVLPGDRRIKSMAYLPFNDPEACIQSVEEFGDAKGVVGFMVTGSHMKPVHHNAYMRLYAMLEERGLPLAFHAGRGWQDQWTQQLNRFIGMHAISFVLCNMVHLTNWVLNGIPVRFPGLKTIWIESGLAWLPFMMQRLDTEYMMRSSEAPMLTMPPSEYIKQMYYDAQPMERSDLKLTQSAFEAINAETQLMYASDWPHWDFDMPNTIVDLPFLSEHAKRNILGLTAKKVFNLDK